MSRTDNKNLNGLEIKKGGLRPPPLVDDPDI
jgi:hypothetical protein